MVYHFTYKECADKIMEFGFDLHLSGQGCIRSWRDSKDSRIKKDNFVMDLETMPANGVINTCIKPAICVMPRDALLRIKLKPTARLLDTEVVEESKKLSYVDKLSYAKQRGYDGLIDWDDVLLFSNKKIGGIERVPDIEFHAILSAFDEYYTAVKSKRRIPP
jgi:hypothetical protein